MPEVIVIDEIGTEAEALAARTIAERGVQLIATAHGNTLDNLLAKPDAVGSGRRHPGRDALRRGSAAARHAEDRARAQGRRRRSTSSSRSRTRTGSPSIMTWPQVVDRYLRGVDAAARAAACAPRAATWRSPHPPLRRPRAGRPKGPLCPLPPEDHERPGRRMCPHLPLCGEPATGSIAPSASCTCRRTSSDSSGEADIVLTLKSQENRQPRRLRGRRRAGMPVHVLRSNTGTQIQQFLREHLRSRGGTGRRRERPLRVEEAIARSSNRRNRSNSSPRTPTSADCSISWCSASASRPRARATSRFAASSSILSSRTGRDDARRTRTPPRAVHHH